MDRRRLPRCVGLLKDREDTRLLATGLALHRALHPPTLAAVVTLSRGRVQRRGRKTIPASLLECAEWLTIPRATCQTLMTW
jgi:hypothetical protein